MSPLSTDFTLASHGDSLQREWHRVIDPEWPSYEVFWRQYVVPLTFRIVESDNPFVRPHIDADFELLVNSQHSTFFHVATMHHWRQYTENWSSESPFNRTEAYYVFFSHAMSARDCALHFAWSVDQLATRYGGTAPFGVTCSRRGNSHKLGACWGEPTNHEQWRSTWKRVARVRNRLVHEAPVFVQHDFVPNLVLAEKLVPSLHGLAAIARIAQNVSLLDHFEPMIPQLERVLTECCGTLDALWRAALAGFASSDTQKMIDDMRLIDVRDEGLTVERIHEVRRMRR